jgi:hypothetical protein
MNSTTASIIYGTKFTTILWACAILLLFLAEALIMACWIRSPRLHLSIGIGRLLATILVVSAPCVAGIRGYSAISGRRSTPNIGSQEATKIWLSRQFLATTVCAYAAIIASVLLLSPLFPLK